MVFRFLYLPVLFYCLKLHGFNSDAENQPKPLVAESERRPDEPESQQNGQPSENDKSYMSSKRLNDEQPNPKKKVSVAECFALIIFNVR